MLIPSCHYADTKHVLFLPPCLFVGFREKKEQIVHLERIPSSSGPECRRGFSINSSVFVCCLFSPTDVCHLVCVCVSVWLCMQSLCEFPWVWVTSRNALSKYNNSQLFISYRSGVWIGWRLGPDPDSAQPISDCLWVSFPQIASIWSFALHIQYSWGWW